MNALSVKVRTFVLQLLALMLERRSDFPKVTAMLVADRDRTEMRAV